ncbi:IS630 family transposase [Rhizophagus irregularis DAOM 181602=DAOM 197198]|nr:IS630 family transposase [Rhizophagus irregularis DAOM 181602=DAOM 197198]
MKPLTPKTRGAIVYGHNCGHSSRTIAKQLGCGKTTVNDILKRLRKTHSLTPKKQTGRPPLLNSPAQQKLKSFIKENNENHRLCSKKIATTWTAQTKQPISRNTIRRNLKKVGLTACVPRRKPAMTEAHCQARLEWAYEHENWTERKWKRVLFSDENTFTQFQQGRQGMVWREPGEELNPNCISVTVKHSPSKMFWRCFSWSGLGPIVPLNGSVTGQTHAQVINDFVVPTLHTHFPQGNGIFQEDNAAPHRSRVAMAARENAGIVTLDWPAYISVLMEYVTDAWNDIPPEYYRKLIKSMPRRVDAVISANGNRINY